MDSSGSIELHILPKMDVSENTKRIVGIDFMRAIAITFVFTQHGLTYAGSAVSWLQRGIFDGVALFFVLSGYLIGRSLLKHVSTNGAAPIQLLHFWCRRAIRTIPPYFVALVVYNVLLSRLHSPMAPAGWQNFLFVNSFAWYPDPAFLEGWSLNVEEWFYLLLVVSLGMLATLYQSSNKRFEWLRVSIVITACALIGLSIVSKTVLSRNISDESLFQRTCYFLTVSRIDAPAYGVLAAVLSFESNIWKSKIFSIGCLIFGVLLLGRLDWLFSIFIPPGRGSYIGFVTTQAAAWALFLPAASAFRCRLSWPVRLIQRLAASAFSIYLWHYSITIFILVPLLSGTGLPWLLPAGGSPIWPAIIVYVVVGLGGAQIFYVLVERPFVRAKRSVNQLFERR